MRNLRAMLLLGLVLMLAVSTASAVNITFQVNMNVQEQLGNFDPEVDAVGVLGDFNGWNTDPDWGVMTEGATNGIYEIEYDLDAGSAQGYKFVWYADGITDDEHTTWETIDNRSLTVPDEDTILDVVFFNDQDTVHPIYPYEVIFQVDMTVAIDTGQFILGQDGVIIRGGHAAIGNWGGFTALSLLPGGEDIYVVSIEFDGLETEVALEYKFLIDVDNDQSDPVIWEELPQGGNRELIPTGDEPDDDEDGFLEIVLDPVFFADNPGGIEQDLSVTFELDGRPAIKMHEIEGIPSLVANGIDEIEFFIITGPWDGTGWVWTDGDLGNVNLFDDGVPPDAVAGDSVFTAQRLFLAGTAINFVYKYGAHGFDNEAGEGENRFVELAANAPEQTIEDQFGENGSIYDDYLYVIEIPTATIPTEFELEQNFPNPFNPSTTIAFSLPAPGETTLRVYNVTGQEVISQSMGNLNAGKYEIHLDASHLSSGVYFYRVEASGLSATKKMILTK